MRAELLKSQLSRASMHKAKPPQPAQLQKVLGNRAIGQILARGNVRGMRTGVLDTALARSRALEAGWPTVQRRSPEKEGDRQLSLGGKNVYDQLISELKDASTEAKTAANRYAIQVGAAAEELVSYAEPKIAELEGNESGYNVVDALVSVFPPVLPYYVSGRAGVKFFDELATGIASLAEGHMRAGIKNAAKLGTSAKDLKKAINLLPKQQKKIASTLPTYVYKKFDTQVKSVMDKDPGVWSREDSLFVRPFMLALHESNSGQIDPIKMEEIIEERIGLPSSSKAIEFQVSLFERWVHAFETKLVYAESSTGTQIWDFVSERQGSSPLKRVAGARARGAAKRLRRELESSTPE